MATIDEFLDHYNREVDYFTEVARTVQVRIEAALLSYGIRVIVTSRAKRPDRLREKLSKRNKHKAYKTFRGIYSDIKDLAGVRVALYFPGDRDRVGRVIEELFTEHRKPKTFPESKSLKEGKRFSGYVATHYFVRLAPEGLQDMQRRYAETPVEIQVASVLMHAWAEVEHDLVYKPEKGDLSEDELAILDEINGMVLSGEIALERLQRAIERRSSKDDVRFNDQFELASYLAQRAAKLEMSASDIGRADVLLTVLRNLRQDTPAHLRRYLGQIEPGDRAQPVANVVLDKVLSAQPKRTAAVLSELISRTLSKGQFGASAGDRVEKAIGYFLTQWITLERTLGKLVPQKVPKRFSLSYALERLKPQLGQQLSDEVARMRFLRNELVHGMQTPDPEVLVDAGDMMRQKLIPAVKGISGSANVPPTP